MANLQININGEIKSPTVSDNSGKLNSQVFTFESTHFNKDFYDPQSGVPSQVTVESLPIILELKFSSNTAILGTVFNIADAGLLSFNLAPKYAIYNSHLYEYSKDIDLIIADYDALGLKLLSNTNGLLTFIDPNNLADIRQVQGIAIEEKDYKFTFTTKSSISNIKSNVATFTITPWENVNIKDNFLLTGANSGIDNPVTGHSIVVDPNDSTKKISTITLQDATVLTTTFTDNDSTTVVSVVDANTRLNRTKIASVDSTNLYESLTALITPTLTGSVLTLKYRNENGIEQTVQVDLSSVVPSYDINLDTATYNAANNTITLTETNGDIYNIDLSEFSIGVTINPDGTADIIQEGVVKISISKVGLSGDYNDLINKPSIPVQDNDLKVLVIPISQLTATPTNENIKALVAEWAVTYAPTKLDIETFAWETIDDNVVVTWIDTNNWNDINTWIE